MSSCIRSPAARRTGLPAGSSGRSLPFARTTAPKSPSSACARSASWVAAQRGGLTVSVADAIEQPAALGCVGVGLSDEVLEGHLVEHLCAGGGWRLGGVRFEWWGKETLAVRERIGVRVRMSVLARVRVGVVGVGVKHLLRLE
eukprot:7389298-Prymnesium_polylepis.2